MRISKITIIFYFGAFQILKFFFISQDISIKIIYYSELSLKLNTV